MILLLAASAAAVFVLIIINLFSTNSLPGILMAVYLSASASFGISCLYGLFERKFAVSRMRFWLAAYLPVLAYLVFHFVKLYYERQVLHQYYMGLGALLMGCEIPIICTAYGLFGIGWLIFCNVMAKRKAAK